MICFDVYVNGEKLCRAGRQDLLVMNCILDWVKAGEGEEELALQVGGLYTPESGGNAHPRWLERMKMHRGDEVTIKILESTSADEPVSETVSTPEWIGEQEKKYFESVKAKFEDAGQSRSGVRASDPKPVGRGPFQSIECEASVPKANKSFRTRDFFLRNEAPTFP